MKWIRFNQVYPHRYILKKDIPKPWRHFGIRVQFLFETAWIIRDENDCVYMSDGQWAETFDFYLKTPGHVIGLRDLATADAHDWRQEWREAMNTRISERLALQASI